MQHQRNSAERGYLPIADHALCVAIRCELAFDALMLERQDREYAHGSAGECHSLYATR
jgi:predicted amidophosphoribosyltransferase